MLIIFNCIIMAPLSYWEIVLLITQSLYSTSITSLTRFPLNLLSKPPGVHCRVETMCTWIPIPTDVVNINLPRSRKTLGQEYMGDVTMIGCILH